MLDAVLLCLQEEPTDLAKADALYNDLCKAAGVRKADQSMEPLRTFFHLKVTKEGMQAVDRNITDVRYSFGLHCCLHSICRGPA
jgi:hypothetical protein